MKNLFLMLFTDTETAHPQETRIRNVLFLALLANAALAVGYTLNEITKPHDQHPVAKSAPVPQPR